MVLKPTPALLSPQLPIGPMFLDPALQRPVVSGSAEPGSAAGYPGREQILNVHMRKVPIAADVRADLIGRGTPGLSGADLANLVNKRRCSLPARTSGW